MSSRENDGFVRQYRPALIYLAGGTTIGLVWGGAVYWVIQQLIPGVDVFVAAILPMLFVVGGIGWGAAKTISSIRYIQNIVPSTDPTGGADKGEAGKADD